MRQIIKRYYGQPDITGRSTYLVAMKALYFDSLVRGFDMFLASLARLELGITFRAIPFGFNAVNRLLMFP